MSSNIKKSVLEEIIRLIVKKIVKEGIASGALSSEEITEDGGASVTGNVSPVTGNKAFVKKNSQLEEMTDSSAAGTLMLPSAFARSKGGSERAVDISQKLGFPLTKAGREEYKRSPDRKLEEISFNTDDGRLHVNSNDKGIKSGNITKKKLGNKYTGVYTFRSNSGDTYTVEFDMGEIISINSEIPRYYNIPDANIHFENGHSLFDSVAISIPD